MEREKKKEIQKLILFEPLSGFDLFLKSTKSTLWSTKPSVQATLNLFWMPRVHAKVPIA